MAGTLTISTLSDGTNSTSATNCIQGSAKAWVNFNGTGTVAIRASYNVTSITDNGVGNYTVNFTSSLSDTNYAVQGTCNNSSAGSGNIAGIYSTANSGTGTSITTSNCKVLVLNDGAAATDVAYVCFSFFR